MFYKKLTVFITAFIAFGFSSYGYAKKRIVVDLSDHRFYAYNNGKLVRSGLISGGSKGRRTVTGNFRIQSKKGYNCFSSKYPRPTGGAHMPYCQFFYKGYAIHGHRYVPRYHASHGCVRMGLNDARWIYSFAPTGTEITVRH
tara:strand:+ start:3247 stop:3672 length:426 start_codon:yes stop_codon:yes gene_type:complete